MKKHERMVKFLIVMAIFISASCAGKKGTDRLHPAFLIPADIVHFVEMTFATDNAMRNMSQNVVSCTDNGYFLLQYYHIENRQVTQYYEFAKNGDDLRDYDGEFEPYFERIYGLTAGLVDGKRKEPDMFRDVPLLISEHGNTYRRILWGHPRELPGTPNGESGMFAALSDSMRAGFQTAVQKKLPAQYARHNFSYLRVTPIYDLARTNIVQAVSHDSLRADAKEWVDIAIRCPYVLIPIPKGVDVFAKLGWDSLTGQYVRSSNYGELYFIETFLGNSEEKRD